MEVLLSAGDRFSIHHNPAGGRGETRPELPMAWERFTRTEAAWRVLERGANRGQMEGLYLFLRQKEADWGHHATPDDQASWHRFCEVALRAMDWERRPEAGEWELLDKLVAENLLLITLEVRLKVLKEPELAGNAGTDDTKELVRQ